MNDTPLSRYFRILEAVAAAPEGLTLSAIAERVALQATTCHRLMNSLVELGLLERQDHAKTYVLGRRTIQLCQLAVTPATIVEVARPILRDLVSAIGETAYLAKLRGSNVESIAMETPQASDKSFVQPGRMMPFHASASAKAIYAFRPPELIAQKLAEPRSRFTPDTKIDEAVLKQELEAVKSQGFAVCDNELDQGVLSFAVPVPVDEWGVVLSLGVVGLSDRLRRLPQQDIVDKLRLASEMFSNRLKGKMTLLAAA